MKLLFPIIFLIFSNSNQIEGYVHDITTGESLVGVMITTATDTTYSDLDGKYTIQLPSDSDKIEYNLISYHKKTIIHKNNILLNNNKIDVKMKIF